MVIKKLRTLLVVFTAFLAIPANPKTVFAADILVLKSQNIPPYTETVDAFLDALGAEGEVFDMAGEADKGEEFLRKHAAKARLVVAIGTKASVTAAETVKDKPVLSLLVSRPEKYIGNRPNVAGISLNPDPKIQAALMKSILPDARRVGMIINAGVKSREAADAETALAGEYELVIKDAGSQEEVPGAVRGIMESADAVFLVMDDSVISADSIRYMVKVAAEKGVPLVGFSKVTVKSGALFSLYTEFADIGRQAALLARKLLTGTPPSSIGFVYAAPTGFAANLNIAKALNVRIPPRVGILKMEPYE